MDTFCVNVKSKLFIYILFFLCFVASLYIEISFAGRLVQSPFNWSKESVDISKTILAGVRCFSLFLGGLLIVTIVSLRKLLVVSLLCILAAITLFEVTSMQKVGNKTSDSYFQQPYAPFVTIFVVLFGIYYSFTRFIFMVLLLNIGGDNFVGCTFACYLVIFSISHSFVSGIIPINVNYPYFIMASIILVTFLFLLIGYRHFICNIDFLQISFRSLIRRTLSRSNRSEIISLMTNQEINIPKSLARLCIFFVLLLPFGFSYALVSKVTTLEFKNMSVKELLFFDSINSTLWSSIINGLTVIITTSLIGLLWYCTTWFKKLKIIWKLIVASTMIIISTLLVPVVVIYREQMKNGTELVTNMPVYYIIPQLVINVIGEVLMITTCGMFMYRLAGNVLKYLSAAFLLGAVSNGGAGAFISIVLYYSIWHTYDSYLYDITTINIICYISSGVILISSIFIVIYSRKLEKELVKPTLQLSASQEFR